MVYEDTNTHIDLGNKNIFVSLPHGCFFIFVSNEKNSLLQYIFLHIILILRKTFDPIYKYDWA